MDMLILHKYTSPGITYLCADSGKSNALGNNIPGCNYIRARPVDSDYAAYLQPLLCGPSSKS